MRFKCVFIVPATLHFVYFLLRIGFDSRQGFRLYKNERM